MGRLEINFTSHTRIYNFVIMAGEFYSRKAAFMSNLRVLHGR